MCSAGRKTQDTRPIKALLFDLGNVLIHFDHMIAARKIAERSGISAVQLFDQFFGSDILIQHDAGKITTEQFFEGVKDRLHFDLDHETFFRIWSDIFVPNQRMFQLAERLLKTTPAYIISNTNQSHFEHCIEIFPVLKKFNGWILSYEVGCLKPDPKIYQVALDKAGVQPQEAFYVDDRQDLVDAARALGLVSHRFTGVDALVKDLTAHGLLNGKV
jgi:glucose-1-phosphatase